MFRHDSRAYNILSYRKKNGNFVGNRKCRVRSEVTVRARTHVSVLANTWCWKIISDQVQLQVVSICTCWMGPLLSRQLLASNAVQSILNPSVAQIMFVLWQKVTTVAMIYGFFIFNCSYWILEMSEKKRTPVSMSFCRRAVTWQHEQETARTTALCNGNTNQRIEMKDNKFIRTNAVLLPEPHYNRLVVLHQLTSLVLRVFTWLWKHSDSSLVSRIRTRKDIVQKNVHHSNTPSS